MHPASDGICQGSSYFHSRAKVMERLGPVSPQDYLQINELLDRRFSNHGDDFDDIDGYAEERSIQGEEEEEEEEEEESEEGNSPQVSPFTPPLSPIYQATRFPTQNPIPRPSLEQEKSIRSSSSPSHSMHQCNTDQQQLAYSYIEESGKQEIDQNKKQVGGKPQQHGNHSSNNNNGDNDQYLSREKVASSNHANMFPLPLPKYYHPARKSDGNTIISGDDMSLVQKSDSKQRITLKDDMTIAQSYPKRVVSREDAKIARAMAHPLPQPPLTSPVKSMHGSNNTVKINSKEKNSACLSQWAPMHINSRTVSAPPIIPRFNISSSSLFSSPRKYPSCQLWLGPKSLVPEQWKMGKELGHGSFGTVYEGLNL